MFKIINNDIANENGIVENPEAAAEQPKSKRVWAKLDLGDMKIKISKHQMRAEMVFDKDTKFREMKGRMNRLIRFCKWYTRFMFETGVPQAKTAQEADEAMEAAWILYTNWWFAQAEADEADNYNDGDKQLEEELPNLDNNIIDYEEE